MSRFSRMVAVFGLVTASGLTVATVTPSPSAAAAEPPAPPPIIKLFDLVQDPVLHIPLPQPYPAETQAALTAFETKAVAEVLQNKSLPPSDELSVRALARDDIRTQLWADLGVIMLKPAASRTATEGLVHAWFSAKVRRTQIGAAKAAVGEYVKWSGLTESTYTKTDTYAPQPRNGSDGYCNYHPPGRYDTTAEYNGRGTTICTESGLTIFSFLVFSPPRPTYDQFVKYGQYLQLEALSQGVTNAWNPLTYNDFTVHAGQVSALVGMGVSLAASGAAIPIARALAVPLGPDNLFVTKLFPFAARAKFVASPALQGAEATIKIAEAAAADAQALRSFAALRAANSLKAGAVTAIADAETAARATEAAAMAEARLTAGIKVFGAITSVVGAIVDIVVTTTVASIQINSDLEAPKKLAELLTKAEGTPDLAALMKQADAYPGMMATFLNETFPEPEWGCSGFIQVGVELHECANAPATGSEGNAPAWTEAEPQFLNGVASGGSVTSWGQTPRISVDLPDDEGSLWVRPHGEGWWILQQVLPDGTVTPEWQSTWFPFRGPGGETYIAERTQNATGKYLFNIAPVGDTALDTSCYPGGGAIAPSGMAWMSCLRDDITYVDGQGRTANVLEMVHGTPPDPAAPVAPPQVRLDGPWEAPQGVPVTFTASVLDDSGPLTYEWLYTCPGAPGGFCIVPGSPTLVLAFEQSGPSHVGVKVTNAAGQIASDTRSFTVSEPTNAIEFAPPADMQFSKSNIYGRPYETQGIRASATSQLPVTFAVDPGSQSVCQLDSGTVTATGVGTCSITASQAGDGVFPAATPVSRAFQVRPSAFLITVSDGPLQYSDPAPSLSPFIPEPLALDGITGTLSGCERLIGLVSATGEVTAEPGSYPLNGCGGYSSDHYVLGYSGATTVTPEDATLTSTTRAVTAPGLAVMTATLGQVDDGHPGDITRARVDFQLFRSANQTDRPDFQVVNQAVNADGLVARTLEGLPADTYRLVIRTTPNAVFAATASEQSLVVEAAVAPSLGLVPANTTVTAGESVTFASSATGNPAPTAQWYRVTAGPTFTAIPDATSPSLTLPAVTYAQNGEQYVVRYTNATGTANSGIVTLTVLPAAPRVVTSPSSTNGLAGGTATFMAAASGDPQPNVQWSSSGDGGVTWTQIAGATTARLTLTDLRSSQSGTRYRAEFTNVGGSAVTGVAVLTVLTQAPRVTSDPQDVTMRSGATATFTAAASGAPAPTVTWQRSRDRGRTWVTIAGADSRRLVVAGVTPAVTGTRYRAVFTNEAGAAASRAATLTVRPR